jgi:predicted dehydrogenase
MDTVTFIMGTKIESVFAELGTFHTRRRRPLGEVKTFSGPGKNEKYASFQVRTEDYASVLLRFGNGARGNLAVSQVAAGRKNAIRIEIYGSKKSAWWGSEDPERLHFGNRDGANETAIRGTPVFGPDAAPYVDYPAGHVEGFPDTFKMLFRSVYGAIAAGKREGLYATAEEGHREVAVCEAIERSQREGRWMEV